MILSKLGTGGFGAVYQVADQRLPGTYWAVKEMSDAAIVDPGEKARAVKAFQQEAQLLARLAHPNIPKVTDSFEENSKHYIVMEYVHGDTLENRLLRQQVPCAEHEVRQWAEQLCDVLTYLHGQNPPIVFRDLKPANIMVTPQGQIKLIDFGIARLFKPGRSLDTEPLGTPGFAPPEQWGKSQTDARSDVYSLGVVLHHLLTLHDPANTPFRLPSVRQLRPGVSVQFDQVIARATQPNMQQRFQSVADFQQALSVGGNAPPPPPIPPSQSRSVSRGIPVWALLALILVALGSGAVIMSSISSGNGATSVPTVVPPRAPTLAPAEPATQVPQQPTPTETKALETPSPTPQSAQTSTPARPDLTDTPTPRWDDYRDAVIGIVDYYGTDIKTQSTTYLDTSRLSDVLILPVLERQRQSVCWLQNEGNYYTYANRSFNVESIEFEDDHHATLLAQIAEDRVLRKQSGGVVKNYGRETYRAIYQLERQGDRWYIYCFQALLDDDPVRCEVIIKTPSPCD
ncbi:MAG: protein kinase [Anaerolineae bacterium]|nr:protein kinase [Anaerolineae bacterium]